MDQLQLSWMIQEIRETLLLTIVFGHLTVLVQTQKDIIIQTKLNNDKGLAFPTQIKSTFTPSWAKKSSQTPLKATTAVYSHTDRPARASPTPWLASTRIKALCPRSANKYSPESRLTRTLRPPLRCRSQWWKSTMRRCRICSSTQNSDQMKVWKSDNIRFLVYILKDWRKLPLAATRTLSEPWPKATKTGR